jgi:Domain of unknown function (DUF3846)
MKAILIDSKAREIREVEYANGADLRGFVGGYIESVPLDLPNGDTLYVDEEGMFKPQSSFFMIETHPTPLAGNGVIVGPEVDDEDAEEGYRTEAPGCSPRSLAQYIRFLDRAQFDAWGKANASEPAITFTSIGPDGKLGEPEVIQRFGSLVRDVPRPKDEKGEAE